MSTSNLRTINPSGNTKSVFQKTPPGLPVNLENNVIPEGHERAQALFIVAVDLERCCDFREHSRGRLCHTIFVGFNMIGGFECSSQSQEWKDMNGVSCC